jgi:hypothetical protein
MRVPSGAAPNRRAMDGDRDGRFAVGNDHIVSFRDLSNAAKCIIVTV